MGGRGAHLLYLSDLLVYLSASLALLCSLNLRNTCLEKNERGIIMMIFSTK